MFTKIVDFFSLVIFSTTTVVNDLPIKEFNSRNYPYGNIQKNHLDMTLLNSNVFEKPVYFLWDLNTFLSRWDLYFSISKNSDFLKLYIRGFKDCVVGHGLGGLSGVFKSEDTHIVNIGLIRSLSNNLLLSYYTNDRILTLGNKDYVSFTFNSLLDYYRSQKDYNSYSFLIRFLNSFIDFNCLSGIAFGTPSGGSNIYLVPKWNNLSGVNLRYFYYVASHSVLTSYANLSFAMLSVDLKGRYVKNNLLIYPVITSSPLVDVVSVKSQNYYYSAYTNLFSTGLTNSFSYNTIVLILTSYANFKNHGETIRFMNFSMLDATVITGWNSEGNTKGWGMFDVVNSQSCVWYDVFCHITASVGWVMNNVIGFKQLSKLVNLFFTPMSLTLKAYQQYNVWLENLPLVSPVIVSGAMLLVLFNFYRRFK